MRLCLTINYISDYINQLCYIDFKCVIKISFYSLEFHIFMCLCIYFYYLACILIPHVCRFRICFLVCYQMYFYLCAILIYLIDFYDDEKQVLSNIFQSCCNSVSCFFQFCKMTKFSVCTFCSTISIKLMSCNDIFVACDAYK